MTLSLHQELIERISDESADLDRTVQRALRSWEKAKTADIDQDLFFDSAALNLQAFYTGLERIFAQTARGLDENLPTGEAWHYELLQQMAQTVPNKRPPLLGPASLEGLDEYRKFRHVVRNVYATNLDPEKIANLLRPLPEIWAQVRAELFAFAEFLRLVEEAE